MSEHTCTYEKCEQKLNAICEHIKTNIPGSRILSKRTSFVMKIFNVVLFFIDFWRFSSTYYPNIYLSDDSWKNYNDPNLPKDSKIRLITTICHEYIHLIDRKRLWLLFDFLYLSPQIFMLLFVFVFITENFLWILALLFLSPIPSIGRTWIEFRGYRVSVSVRYWLTGKLDDLYIEWVISRFLDHSYYWMFPFRKCLQKLFTKHVKNLKENKNLPKEVLEIKNILDV